MSRVRAADDFDAIRLRLEELRREREEKYGGEPIVERPIREPDAVAHVPRHVSAGSLPIHAVRQHVSRRRWKG